MNERYDKLKGLLMELFQLDQPDLDFGIYRILHARKHEIEAFLDKTLPQQVQEALGQYWAGEKETLQKELALAKEQAISLGLDPSQVRKVQELEDSLKETAAQAVSLENEVYDHLYNFFRRYYSEGDFVSKRVYKEGVYAIPYEGEEVKLYWANSDQYYIKTSEYLRDYTFRLRPWSEDQPMRVHFKIVDAAEEEHGNVKPAEGKERVFILTKESFISIENGELVLRFEYRPATLADWLDEAPGKAKPPTQKDLIAIAVKRVFNVNDPALAPWITELQKEHILANNEKAGYSKLEAHLNRYTKRNTFDYFIHKDLGGFLRRELDFYLKSEVMRLDDIEDETAPRVEQYLRKVKVIRRIAGKIIDFLAQIENFQKKLWLKKKFVVDTHYLITLDNIPEEFYPEIAANNAQRDEWVRLFGIDQIKGDFVTPGYSVPLTVEFLKANPTLVLDTRHFSQEFKQRLIHSLDELDDRTDGLLIHSENFQALSLLQRRYQKAIKAIIIDPPYNRQGDGFPYKDNYRHSSWLTMMRDRTELAWRLLDEDGVLFSHIDENERDNLVAILNGVFGTSNRIEELIWAQNTTHNQSPLYSTNHEYIEVYARNRSVVEANPTMFREPKPGFRELMQLIKELNASYPSIATVEERIQRLFAEHLEEYKNELRDQGLTYDEETKKLDPWRGLYPYCHAEYRDEAGQIVPEQEAAAKKARLVVWQEADASAPAQKQASSTRDPNDPNYRFYRPLHPRTGKPCPCPKSGWRWPYRWPDASRESFESLDRQGRIVWGEDETKVPRQKRFLHEVETNVAKSFFHDYTDGEKQIAALFGASGLFPTPKPTTLPSRFINHTGHKSGVILDHFAGSGTTGHAVINLNREDGGNRKFILVEMADYFESVLVPRIKKAIYAPEWRDGRPSRVPTPEEVERSPRIIKVLQLESYEDTLNNLELRRSSDQKDLLKRLARESDSSFSEDYLLHYMLDLESRDSLLNVEAFKDPTAYKLRVKLPGSDETREVNVDLLETFTWLLGLTVHHISAPQTFHAEFERNEEGRLIVKKGSLRPNPNGPWWFRTVEGINPEGQRVLIIWRKLTGDPEKDNVVLDYWFEKQGFSARDSEFDLIYVNGGHNLGNRLEEGAGFKVRLIEEEFHRLMFETEGV